MDRLVELLHYVVLEVLGWLTRAFRRWLDRQPHRDPSQISTLHKIGRLALGVAITLAVLLPLGWLIFK
jgi:hypothetical protein